MADRDSRRGVDVVRVGNALITHSFVASRNVAESEDNAGHGDPRMVASPAEDAARRRSSALQRLHRKSTNRATADPVDPGLREVLQALMHTLLPTEHCRLLTSLDIANAGAQRQTGSVVATGKLVLPLLLQQRKSQPDAAATATESAAATAPAALQRRPSASLGGVLGKLLRRTSSQPEMGLRPAADAARAGAGARSTATLRGARASHEYFVALISNRQSGIEEDAVFILRARAADRARQQEQRQQQQLQLQQRQLADGSGKLVRRAASLQKLPLSRRASAQRPQQQPLGPGLRRAESFVADSLQAAAAAAPLVDLDIVKVMPVWSDLRIKLRGRGLLRLTSAGESIRIATVSVRSMWRLVSSLQRARALAKASNLFPQGPSHRWISRYLSDELTQTDAEFDAAFATTTASAARAEGEPPSPGTLGAAGAAADAGTGGAASAAAAAAGEDAAEDGRGDEDDDDEDDHDDATSVSVNTAMSGLGLGAGQGRSARQLQQQEHQQQHEQRRDSPSAANAEANAEASPGTNSAAPRMSQRSLERAEAAVVDEIRVIIGRCGNLDELTTSDVVRQLEVMLGADVMSHFKKSFIDEKIMLIYGQQEPPSRIAPGLYLGTEYNAANFSELTDMGVRDIVNVTKEIKNFFPDLFDYYRVSVRDTEKADLATHLPAVVQHIVRAREQGRTVLVHCQRGISRSASVVIAYLMTVEQSSCQEATRKVELQRPVIKPNRGFKKQLLKYEASLRRK